MNTYPLVSVLITAFNREGYLPFAIESVLASTYANFELIIVDDHSTDDTVTVAKKYELQDNRVKVYVNEKNLGDYHNRNRAASYASGKYIKYLDSDDIMYPHCLQVMVNCMEAFPDAGFGLCSMADVDKPLPTIADPHQAYSEHFNGYGHFNRAPGSAIISRNAFQSIGGFSGKRWVGDTELWFKLAKKFNLVKLPAGLYWDRQHEEKESKSEAYRQNKILCRNMKKELMDEMLSASDCPLSKEEIESIKFSMKKHNIKAKIKNLLAS